MFLYIMLPHNKPVKQSSVNALTLSYHNCYGLFKDLVRPSFLACQSLRNASFLARGAFRSNSLSSLAVLLLLNLPTFYWVKMPQ